MPVYEFICNTCGQPFEELLRSSKECDEVNCPVCGSIEVKKKLSIFASRITGASSLLTSAGSATSCNTGNT